MNGPARRIRIANPRTVFVVTDPGLLATGIVDRALESLKAAGIDAVVFSDVQADPPQAMTADFKNQFRPNIREESRYVNIPRTGPARSEVLCKLSRAYDFLVRGIGGAENQFVHFLVWNGSSPGRPSFLGHFDLEHVCDLAPAMLTLIAEGKLPATIRHDFVCL
jgi:hypothetical protein